MIAQPLYHYVCAIHGPCASIPISDEDVPDQERRCPTCNMVTDIWVGVPQTIPTLQLRRAG
jgi:hypothetical protein